MADPSPAAADAAMERYAAGDDLAFSELYDCLAPRRQGYLVRTLHVARAVELVQQTFLQMHRATGRFVPGAEVMPWAFAIARRLLIDGIRRRRREVLVASEEDTGQSPTVATEAGADDLVQAQELALRIQVVLASLPETQRVAFELVTQEGLSIAEAAHVLGARRCPP